jgi:hypothetical protein
MVPGGTWWRHVQVRIAECDGDAETLAQFQAEQEQEPAAILAGAGLRCSGLSV